MSIPGINELMAAVDTLSRDAKEHLTMRRTQMSAPHCPAHEKFDYTCELCLQEADARI